MRINYFIIVIVLLSITGEYLTGNRNRIPRVEAKLLLSIDKKDAAHERSIAEQSNFEFDFDFPETIKAQEWLNCSVKFINNSFGETNPSIILKVLTLLDLPPPDTSFLLLA